MPPPSRSNTTQMQAPAVHPVVREVTEDTPPDLLEGKMDLLVTLPSKKSVRMTVDRRTPMMDLLIQVTTTNKISPAGHIAQVKNERGIELPYKPSTPIGMLDTTTIEIVPKNQVNEYIIVKKQAKHVNPLFEKTFRLQVHLPRNQLYVLRVGPRTVLQDILEEVCLEKNLDMEKYEIRHPVNLDEKLDLSYRLGDYGLQELTIVSRNSRINSSVSSADIMALQQIEDRRVKGRLDSAFKYSRSSVGDSSVSSESATSGRGISPSRSASDESRSISPLLPINHPKLKLDKTISNPSGSSETGYNIPKSGRVLQQSTSMDIPGKQKKRAAPAPPPASVPTTQQISNRPLTNSEPHSQPPESVKPKPRKKDPPRDPPILPKQQSLPATHSRHSSDSSGYHESSNEPIPELNEHKRAERSTSTGGTTVETTPLPMSNQSASNSRTNLTSVSSLSSTSLTSNGGLSRRKGKAPKPPGLALQAQNEVEEDISIPITETTENEMSSSKMKDWDNSPRRTLEEVKVDVHDVNQMQSPQSEDDETETEKESLAEKKYNTRQTRQLTKSSSTASSLSGRIPLSESGSSSSSSPLPTDLLSSPNSQLSKIGDSPLPSSRDRTDVTSNMSAQSSIISRSSSVNQEELSSAAVIATPLPQPQPRTKPRTRNIPAQAPAPVQPPIPVPRVRPRPDRESPILPESKITTELAAPTVVNNPIEERIVSVSAPTRGHGAGIRNIGVKVFPDNAMGINPQTRFAALKKPKSIDELENEKQNRAKAIATQLENANSSLIKIENNKILINQSPPGRGDDSDSDNLEENLELFEGRELNKSDKSNISSASSFEDISFQQKNFKKSRKTLTSISSDSKIDQRKFKDDEDEENYDDSSSTTLSEIPQNKALDQNLSFTRTHSDLQLKTNLSSKLDSENQLNRWENEESLHDIERERLNSNPSNMSKTYNKTNRKRDTTSVVRSDRLEANNRKTFVPATSTTSTINSLPDITTPTTTTSLIKRKTVHPTRATRDETLSSSEAEIQVHDTNEDVGEMMTSSESEASYADSGIPATANVTPSPISLEHDHDIDRSDKDVQSIGSSRRSSIHSDHSESWREILQAKVENPSQNLQKAMEAIESDEVDKTLTDLKIKSSTNFQMVRAQPVSTLGISTEPNQLISKPEDEADSLSSSASDEDSKMNKSEVDVGNHSATRKLSKSESFTHTSEFDVKTKRKLFSANGFNNRTRISGMASSQLKGKSSLSSSDEDVRQDESDNLRFNSMQNLSNADNSYARVGPRENSAVARRRGNGKGEEKVFRKATSVLGLEDVDPDIAATNPELRQTFQVELEAQFEQWKEEFLQKHVRGSKSASIDSTSSDQIQNLPKSTSESETQLKEQTAEVEVKKNSVTEVSPTLVTQSNENLLALSHSKVDDEGFDPERPQIVHSVSGARNLKVVEVESEKLKEISRQSIENLNFVPEAEPVETTLGPENTDKKMKGVEPKAQTEQVYRYSGPPAIQMGTWGERPRGAISVKKDTDYIMGMGQNDAKAAIAVTEAKPTFAPLGSRVQAFNGVSNITSASKISPVNKPTANAPSKWSGPVVKTVSPMNDSTSKTTGSIVSNWKQRMQESELERKQEKEEVKVQQGRVPDIKIEVKSISTTSTLEKPSKTNFTISSASNTLDRPAFKKVASVTSLSPTLSQVRNNYESKLTIEQKPKSNGLKSTQSFQSNSIGKQSGSFNETTPNNATLEEKKAFFQGIKPAESPTKEVPLPAVNMKSNIATIQRVFEQRQPTGASSNASTRESSPSLSASSSSTNLSNSSKLPDLIGQNSSSLMLQRVMKTQAFNMDYFRRTPSPSLSSPERFTPSPTPAPPAQFNNTVVDGPVRISTKTNNMTNSSGSIKNMDNKAIIIVTGDTPTSNNNNIFKQQLKLSATAKPVDNSKINSVKISVNGLAKSEQKNNTVILHTTPAPSEEVPTKRDMIIVHKNNENNNNTVTKQALKPVQFKDLVNRSAPTLPPPQTENAVVKTATPPPPPPPPDITLISKPQNLNLSSKATNGSLSNGKVGTPTSPMSSDPRAEICSAISGGNFRLKKTGSTVLLQ